MAVADKLGKFLTTLKHSDLPAGWQKDPEIVEEAARLWREQGTESPFFKAWFGNSKIVDEDGLPQKVYHGSESVFDVFDATKSRANMDIQGNFFSPWDIDANGYGRNLYETYLNIDKPANSSQGYKALKAHAGENGAGISAREDLKRAGYNGVNNDNEEFIAFMPEQIKSTSNRGTFDPSDPNIYRSFAAPVGIGGGLLGAMAASDTQAAQNRPYQGKPDLPLQTPAWDPIDILTAPIGVAGNMAKGAWMAATPFVNEAFDGLIGMFGRN